MKREARDECVPMRCAVCSACCRARDWQGKLTTRCTFGGPFRGYAHTTDKPVPAPPRCVSGACPIKPGGPA